MIRIKKCNKPEVLDNFHKLYYSSDVNSITEDYGWKKTGLPFFAREYYKMIEKIQEQGVVEMKKLDALKERETLYFDILCAFNRPDAEKRYRMYIEMNPDDMRKEDYFNSIIKYGIVIGWNESIDEDTLDRIYYLCDKYNWVRDSVIKPKED